jgi:predicted nucleic acid-binding protein
MIVVADSGPLHYLILLEQVDLLRRFYGHVVVPEAVASELSNAAAPGVVSGWIAAPPSWLEVRPVAPEVLAAITDDLDLGERAAIALAEAMRADLLLIDEAAGRAEAKRRHLRVTGTLGVLRSGAERGLVNVPELLARLKTTSFYLDEALVSMVFAPWLPRS